MRVGESAAQLRDDASRSCLDALAPREREVALLISEGLTSSAVAERLSVKPGTVRATLSRIYDKLGVSNRQELTEMIRNEVPATTPADDTGQADSSFESGEREESTVLEEAARMLLPFSSLLMLMGLTWLGLRGSYPHVSSLSMSVGLLVGFIAVGWNMGGERTALRRGGADEAPAPPGPTNRRFVALGALVALTLAQCALYLVLFVPGIPAPAVQLLGIALYAAASAHVALSLLGAVGTSACQGDVTMGWGHVLGSASLLVAIIVMRLLSAGRIIVFACLVSQALSVTLLRACGTRRWTLCLPASRVDAGKRPAEAPLLATGPDWFAFCLAFYVVGQRYAEVQQQLPLASLPFLALGAYGLIALRDRMRFDPIPQAALALGGAAALATFTLPSPQLFLLFLEGLAFAWCLSHTWLDKDSDASGLQSLVPSCLSGLALGDVAHGCLQWCYLTDAATPDGASSLLTGAAFLLTCLIVGVGVGGGLAFASSCLSTRARTVVEAESESAPRRLERFQSYLRFRGLSDAQVLVAMKSLEGKTAGEIAAEMSYAPSTVKALRTSLYRKLSIQGIEGLISLYEEVTEP